jgi:hypothetical protein
MSGALISNSCLTCPFSNSCLTGRPTHTTTQGLAYALFNQY